MGATTARLVVADWVTGRPVTVAAAETGQGGSGDSLVGRGRQGQGGGLPGRDAGGIESGRNTGGDLRDAKSRELGKSAFELASWTEYATLWP